MMTFDPGSARTIHISNLNFRDLSVALLAACAHSANDR